MHRERTIVYAHELGDYGKAMRNSYAAIASPFHANLHTSAELAHMQQTGIDIDPEIARRRAEEGALMRGRGLVASFLHAGMKLGVTPLLGTSAVKLVKDRDRVVGVEVERDGTGRRTAPASAWSWRRVGSSGTPPWSGTSSASLS